MPGPLNSELYQMHRNPLPNGRATSEAACRLKSHIQSIRVRDSHPSPTVTDRVRGRALRGDRPEPIYTDDEDRHLPN